MLVQELQVLRLGRPKSMIRSRFQAFKRLYKHLETILDTYFG